MLHISDRILSLTLLQIKLFLKCDFFLKKICLFHKVNIICRHIFMSSFLPGLTPIFIEVFSFRIIIFFFFYVIKTRDNSMVLVDLLDMSGHSILN